MHVRIHVQDLAAALPIDAVIDVVLLQDQADEAQIHRQRKLRDPDPVHQRSKWWSPSRRLAHPSLLRQML